MNIYNSLYRIWTILTTVFLIFTPLQAQEKKFYLSIVAMFQNEAPYLKEWIEYHKILGVEHFYLFNNLSKDNYMPVLKPYIEKGEVELFDWPYKIEGLTDFLRCQSAVYSRIAWKEETHWLGIIDIDEFIVPAQTYLLTDFLHEYEDFSALFINWQVFGTSKVEKVPKNKLQIEMLTWKAYEKMWMNRLGKTIVKPADVLHVANSHVCNLKPGCIYVNENRAILPSDMKARSKNIHVEKIQINHYWTRDQQYFRDVKLKLRSEKGGQTPQEVFYAKNQTNKIKDERILKYLPALRKAMKR